MLARAVQCQPLDLSKGPAGVRRLRIHLAIFVASTIKPAGRGKRVCRRVSQACARGGRRARGRARPQISPRDLDARPTSLVVTPHALPRGARTPPRRASPAPRSPRTCFSEFRSPRFERVKLVRATRPETRGDRRRATATGTERYAPVYAPQVRAEPVAPRSNLASRARGRARARSPRAVPAKTHQPLVSLTSAGKAQHEMAGADGATEVPPDATYAALEGPRFVTAPEPARQSVLSHSKSHPRMLESASTSGHSPALSRERNGHYFPSARPNDPRRLCSPADR